MLQTRNSPIIVGEQYELAETLGHGGDHDTGLLAKSEYQAALLSMSEYDRHAASAMTGMCIENVPSLRAAQYHHYAQGFS